MATTKWSIDPTHSEIHFKVKHLMITTVTGSFGKFSGTAETEDEDFTTAKINFSADVNSISTGVADRDGHLKSADFFDAANYPELAFTGTKFAGKDSDFELEGDLTIRGTTKKVKVNVEFGGITKDPWGSTRAGFTISGKINRKDFGLSWGAVTEAGGVVVSDEVKIAAEVQFVKQA
ncbi:YceI family protein [Ferruginibacter albus]|uniref:YceI family protein n=1 Tax=Ferruginibacter albus TaxID=2875540 RepID=UPI001CC52760|nr:YceI family protein [Ferruginibacter albus]UAY51365.1 YceI family protein [Ferruginibacter albus]